MKLFTRCRFRGATLMAVILAGCARTTVRPAYQRPAFGLPPPERVLVYDFAVSAKDVAENQALFSQAANSFEASTQDERELEIGRNVADRMAEDLVAGIRELGLPAARANRQTPVPVTALLITGEFLNVDEGNRLRRLVIGFGAGGSAVESRMHVMARSGSAYRKLAEFTTHADSGKMPGAAVTMGAGAAAQGGATVGMVAANAAVGGVKAYRSEVERMAGSSADQAVAYLSEYFAEQGWISADKVRRAKRADW